VGGCREQRGEPKYLGLDQSGGVSRSSGPRWASLAGPWGDPAVDRSLQEAKVIKIPRKDGVTTGQAALLPAGPGSSMVPPSSSCWQRGLVRMLVSARKTLQKILQAGLGRAVGRRRVWLRPGARGTVKRCGSLPRSDDPWQELMGG